MTTDRKNNMNIRFKYEHDPLSGQYVLTSKIYFEGGKLYLWDTTIEETYSRALQLAYVKANVEWEFDDDEEEEEEYKSYREYLESEAYRDEEQRVCRESEAYRDRCLAELDGLEGYNYKYRSKYDEEGYNY